MLRCSKCGIEKPDTLFPKKGRQCKACVAARDKTYVAQNRATVQARKNAWQQEKRETIRAERPVKPLSPLQQAILSGSKTYFTGLPCAQGHVADRLVSSRGCCECAKIVTLAYKEKNKAALLSKKRAYAKAYRLKYPERVREIAKKTALKRVHKDRALSKAWRQKNKSRVLAWTRQRQLAKMQRTPAWLTDDDLWIIEQAYELAALRKKMFGFAWHVDHILPLRGKTVSGLHVPTNLQVIPGIENSKKSNRVEVA